MLFTMIISVFTMRVYCIAELHLNGISACYTTNSLHVFCHEQNAQTKLDRDQICSIIFRRCFSTAQILDK